MVTSVFSLVWLCSAIVCLCCVCLCVIGMANIIMYHILNYIAVIFPHYPWWWVHPLRLHPCGLLHPFDEVKREDEYDHVLIKTAYFKLTSYSYVSLLCDLDTLN